ncbi:hypothetical protein [Legionella brunensis]|uniref:Ninein n=1 Tax=Legionella brunensis TaxID=29422 RepID=A0A0W0STP2_9GAMM|nr:hypothetical protein [Legionella brunensis]KTC86644.1 ninein [Legionella brunensis]
MTPEDLALLIQTHKSLTRDKLLNRFQKWSFQTFICPPPSAELSEFELLHGKNAIDAEKFESKNLEDLKSQTLKAIEQQNFSEAYSLFKKLVKKLDLEKENMEEDFKNGFLSKTPKAITSPIDYREFLHGLYRIEFAFRLNLYQHYAATEALLSCLSKLWPLPARITDDENQQEFADFIRNQLPNLREAHAELQRYLNAYNEAKPIVKKHIESSQPKLNQSKEKFTIALATLAVKVAKLYERAQKDENYRKGSDEAIKLYRTLIKVNNDYFGDTPQINYSEFQQRCQDAIDSARTELEKHRGWTEVLWNLTYIVLSIASLGTANLISNWVNSRYCFLPVPKTDSAKKLDDFASVLPALQV